METIFPVRHLMALKPTFCIILDHKRDEMQPDRNIYKMNLLIKVR